MSNIFRYFKYLHLPKKLQKTSKEFYHMAEWVWAFIPDGEEKDACLRKLLEAKDCAVRASIPDENDEDKRCYFTCDRPEVECVSDLIYRFDPSKCNYWEGRDVTISCKEECVKWR